jgi:hypothetical protein
MKVWHKAMLIATACVLCFVAGSYYSGTNDRLIRCLLNCIAILLATWMELSSKPSEI